MGESHILVSKPLKGQNNMVRVGREKEFRDTKNKKAFQKFSRVQNLKSSGRKRQKEKPGSLLLQLLKAETKGILEPARETRSPASREIVTSRALLKG